MTLASIMIAAAMPLWGKIVLIVLGVILAILVVLVLVSRKVMQKQEASQAQIEAASQVISMLIIDKKRMRAKDANMPKMIADQIPKYMRLAKLPIVKAKVGPRVMTLIADEKIFDDLPVKTEVKVAVSGMYITEIKYVRGKVDMPKKKKSWFKRLQQKAIDNARGTDTTETKKKKK